MDKLFSENLKKVDADKAKVLGFIYAQTYGLMMFYKSKFDQTTQRDLVRETDMKLL
jgi:hypothetical protein